MPVEHHASLHGLLLVDKPVGPTSARVVAKVKRQLRVKKAGHCGTLDPLASGLLPIALGEGTKASQFLLDADKRYEVELTLGLTSDTLDISGALVDTGPVEVSEAEVRSALDNFRGPIEQLPPMFSALKRDGKPLYEYARDGIVLERSTRAVEIFHLELVGWETPRAQLFVHCSKGTYVRTLVHDLGQRLGCGAVMSQLRRTSCGPFSVEGAIALDALCAGADPSAAFLTLEQALAHLEEVVLGPEASLRFAHGNPVALTAEETCGRAADALLVRGHEGRLLAIGRTVASDDGFELQVVRGLNL
ncbi:MAG: tRNA pseudouridine(55) synthase TruB, partial [Myxococcales bacterium]|nr:tRNA pseudouridine(55) synthase TruB [Myxococcales bacterium]